MLRQLGWAALSGAMLLGACAGVPPRATPPVLRDAASLALTGAPAAPLAPEWWHALGDPQLDAILAAALADNPSVAAALARLSDARALLAESGSTRGVQAAADGSLLRQRLSGRSYIPPPFAGSTLWAADARVQLEWNLDFFGRQRALIAAAGATARAAELEAATARLAIVSGVAAAYVDLARAYALGDVARDLVASRQQSLRLAQTRRRTGLGSDFELRAGETLLAEARQAAVRADAARTLATHALAALAGRGVDFSAGVVRPRVALDRMAALPAAVPADLLNRRPDLLAARWRVEAALGGQAAARADFFPAIDLRAVAGLSSITLGGFVSPAARTYGLGPAFRLPLFDGGRLRARHAQAEARVALAVADYDSAALTAVREASDALARVTADEADLVEQRRILAGLDATIRLDRTRVATGLASQLDLLETGTRVLAARQAEAELMADSALRRVQLLTALGGGFTPTADAEPPR